MESDKLDRVLEAEELIQGLIDLMYTIHTAQQDELVPLTILSPFEAVLQRVHSLLKEIEKSAQA